MTADEFAPAKVNLTLHVTGQRQDGYHLLDSLVVFARIGDVISSTRSDTVSLEITGPQSASLAVDDDNLVLRAARLLGSGDGAALTLEKHLPVASGIGGGSADAAATLRLLSRVWGRDLPADAGLSLGADVPVCLAGRSARMRGIGDIVDPVFAVPSGMGMVLVNPRVHVPTPQIFKTLDRRDNDPMPDIPACDTPRAFCDWLAKQRNDMQSAAIAIAPVIQTVIDEIGRTDCLLSRMSGSGATCFGLYETVDAACVAAETIRSTRPDWWVAASGLVEEG